ncbi:hypothetical protein LX36DRAFT_53923 [Colletotrichum falcatum]|nr:hypothetical protein LX36DRAFT_53923 [Colletotrichum falcatum]
MCQERCSADSMAMGSNREEGRRETEILNHWYGALGAMIAHVLLIFLLASGSSRLRETLVVDGRATRGERSRDRSAVAHPSRRFRGLN